MAEIQELDALPCIGPTPPVVDLPVVATPAPAVAQIPGPAIPPPESDAKIENEEFYKFIVQLTKSSTGQGAFQRDCETVAKIILRDFRTNIQLAASKGRNVAYLCIYDRNAKYKETVPVHDYLSMPDHIKTKFQEFKMEPIVDRLKKNLQPFHLEIRPLRECLELDTYIPDLTKLVEKLGVNDELEIMIVSVSWEKKV
jgi:hypothetical protein